MDPPQKPQKTCTPAPQMMNSTRPSRPDRASSNKNGKMSKINLMFSLILIWGIATTMLLVKEFQNNTTLQRQISENKKQFRVTRKVQKQEQEKQKKKFDDKIKELHSQKGRKGKTQKKQDNRQVSMVTNRFPFTRSLENFKTSNSFFLYVVKSTSPLGDIDADASSSPLEWSEVRWKDLVVNWGRDTTFDDLLQMSTLLDSSHADKRKSASVEVAMPKKLILHCLPKAASTTIRRACYKHMKDHCEAIDFPVQQDPFGYRNVEDFFTAVKVCKNIDHFCVQGGDAGMSVINYEGKEGDIDEEEEITEREPFHFVHMVPFRNFDDWVESAIKQLFTIDGNCDRIDRLLDDCLGYRELYMELYPKSVLSLLTGMAFYANGKGISGKDKHHILLYNYKDTESIIAQVSDLFGMDPLPRMDRRHKEQRGEGTCPATISEKFHLCHDKTLMKADAIRGLPAELKRRVKNDRKMKQLMGLMKKEDSEMS